MVGIWAGGSYPFDSILYTLPLQLLIPLAIIFNEVVASSIAKIGTVSAYFFPSTHKLHWQETKPMPNNHTRILNAKGY